jgi:hypothetical protein
MKHDICSDCSAKNEKGHPAEQIINATHLFLNKFNLVHGWKVNPKDSCFMELLAEVPGTGEHT